MPHAGTFIPDPTRQRLTAIGNKIVDTDWHVDKLYDFAKSLDITLLVATHSRTVVDLNRDPEGKPLYSGQAETTICPTETFDGDALYFGDPPDAREIAARTTTYWRPYHDALRQQLDRIRQLHGSVILLDGHSIRQRVPRLFAGKLPDLNYGTNDGSSAAPDLAAMALAATASSGFSQVLNGRFRGGYITRHYGNPAANIHAIQLEMAWTTYLDESEPETWRPGRAAPLIAALRRLVAALLDA